MKEFAQETKDESREKQCDNFHIQLRTGKTDLMDHAWKKHQIHAADILDVLWDEWNKGKTIPAPATDNNL